MLPLSLWPSGPGLRSALWGLPSVGPLLASFLSACSYSVSAADQLPAFSAARTCFQANFHAVASHAGLPLWHIHAACAYSCSDMPNVRFATPPDLQGEGRHYGV
jgi:hypothetical protein